MAYEIKTTSGATIFTLGMGVVRSERSTKDAQLFQMPMPTQDSSYSVILNLFGTNRTIVIEGTFTGSSANIATFIGQLDGLVNGSLQTKKYYSDTSNTSYYVVIQSVEWKRGEGEVTKIDYSIQMIESILVS